MRRVLQRNFIRCRAEDRIRLTLPSYVSARRRRSHRLGSPLVSGKRDALMMSAAREQLFLLSYHSRTMCIVFGTHPLLLAIRTKAEDQRAYAAFGRLIWQLENWLGHGGLPAERELLSLRRKVLGRLWCAVHRYGG